MNGGILNTWLEAQIEVEDGKITNIYPYGTKEVDEDYGEKRIVPGFIDVHTHGAYGFDTNDAEEEGLRTWLKNIVKEGVTGILPTTITQSEEVLTAAVSNVAKVVREAMKVLRYWVFILKVLIWIKYSKALSLNSIV